MVLRANGWKISTSSRIDRNNNVDISTDVTKFLAQVKIDIRQGRAGCPSRQEGEAGGRAWAPGFGFPQGPHWGPKKCKAKGIRVEGRELPLP